MRGISWFVDLRIIILYRVYTSRFWVFPDASLIATMRDHRSENRDRDLCLNCKPIHLYFRNRLLKNSITHFFRYIATLPSRKPVVLLCFTPLFLRCKRGVRPRCVVELLRPMHQYPVRVPVAFAVVISTTRCHNILPFRLSKNRFAADSPHPTCNTYNIKKIIIIKSRTRKWIRIACVHSHEKFPLHQTFLN